MLQSFDSVSHLRQTINNVLHCSARRHNSHSFTELRRLYVLVLASVNAVPQSAPVTTARRGIFTRVCHRIARLGRVHRASLRSVIERETRRIRVHNSASAYRFRLTSYVHCTRSAVCDAMMNRRGDGSAAAALMTWNKITD